MTSSAETEPRRRGIAWALGMSIVMISASAADGGVSEGEERYARLAVCLAERWREVVPPGIEVTATGDRLSITAVSGRSRGSSGVGMGKLALMLPIPARLRLRFFFEDEARAMQEFVSRVTGHSWPGEGAQPYARVTERDVQVWYGLRRDAEPILRLRSLLRADIGL